jgi:DNA repair protein SbcD/Mre11
MRILHTADWHLGKRLDFFSRIEEQREVLNEICQIAEDNKVDVVVIAGDLFDTFNPPTEASELLYTTAKRLAKNGRIPVIAIAGNHDSPDKINMVDALALSNGIIFIGEPNEQVKKIQLENGFEITRSDVGFIEIKLPNNEVPLRVIHTAFANEIRLKEYLGEDKQIGLQEMLSHRWNSLVDKYCDDKGVTILTTHLYMLKNSNEIIEEPDGEKPLNIGTADLIDSSSVPTAVQYAALGHLHRYQDVGNHQPVIYSSAILPYSFSEAGQQKYVVLVDLEPQKEPVIQRVALTKGRELKRVTFDSVDLAVEWLNNNPTALVELTIETDTFLKAEERKRIQQAHDGIIHLIPKIKSIADGSENTYKAVEIKEVVPLFIDYFKSENGGIEPNDEIMSLFKEIMHK